MRIKVITNLPAPYRQPIWDYLANKYNLHVVFLLGKRNWRGWLVDGNKKWSYEFLDLKMIKFKEIEVIPWPFGVRKILKNCDLLILSGWHTPMYILLTLLAKRRVIPIIQFYESFEGNSAFKSRTLRTIKAKILNLADRIVTVSKLSNEYLMAIGIPERKITTLFNPIHYEGWVERLPKSERNFEKSSFLFVGQLIERKGVKNLILAFDKLEDNDYELEIVGDGPLKSELMSVVARSSKSERIRFFGNQTGTELHERFASNRILILPSAEEVWGLVVNEALASGMHVVVSAQCGVAEFVKDMAGVTIYEEGLDNLIEAMDRAKRNFGSRIENPEMRKYGCIQFAQELEQIIDKIKASTHQ